LFTGAVFADLVLLSTWFDIEFVREQPRPIRTVSEASDLVLNAAG